MIAAPPQPIPHLPPPVPVPPPHPFQWVGDIDPTRYQYVAGSATEFSDLATSSLAGFGDTADTFDSDLAAVMALLPALGAGFNDVADIETALDSAVADLQTDDWTPLLQELSDLGTPLDAAISAIDFLDDFGQITLDFLSPFLSNMSDLLAGAEADIGSIGQSIADLTAEYSGLESEIQSLFGEIGGFS